MESIPLVMVHGWKSHPGIWRRLIEQVRIPSEQIWLFDYSSLYESTISQIAHQLKSFLHEKRRVAGYHGPVDIVCHSMGGYVTRYYVEVLDGKKREEKVRQLIEIGVRPLKLGKNAGSPVRFAARMFLYLMSGLIPALHNSLVSRLLIRRP